MAEKRNEREGFVMTENIEREYMGWDALDDCTRSLVASMREQQWKPTLVVAVARGGMDVVENPPEKKTSFMYADLTGADFSGCDLSGCDFTYAKLAGANFQNAILTNTVFAYADLQNASFVGANFCTNS